MTGLGRVRRRVVLARASSDVTRFRGLVPAALAGALALVIALLWGEGPKALLAPGPLARPHAALACSSCHATAAAEDACASCHAEHPSRRRGHRELAAAGKLGCATCHDSHGDAAGLAFEPDGSVKLYGSGFERELAVSDRASPNPGSTTLVPLVRERACASCHRLEAPRDPAAHCFAAGPNAARAAGFALCFDEHRQVAARGSGQAAARDAAVESARAVVRSQDLVLASFVVTAGSSALYVLFGVVVGFAALELGRRVARRRERSPEKTPIAANAVRRLPVIDASHCLGCDACVDACPYDALEVRRYVAVLARPDDCCGAGPCQESCPNGSLILRSDEAPLPGPVLSPEFESPERPGLFVAGDAGGGTLIRNAVRQGVAVAETIAARRAARSGRPELLDLIVVGAGPAGLAAALTAKARGLGVLVLEQASVAESIRRFSRGKLVLDTPAQDEAELPLFVADAPKEELLSRWLRSVRRAKLEVCEDARVVEVAKVGPEASAHFRVRVAAAAQTEREYRARNVLLAVGSRGTPRKLPVPVPGRLEAHVHYELSDARAFAGKRAIVIGLGDVAMETALALAAQPGTEVSVLHRGAGFNRGKQRNIAALSAAVARGRVKLWFRAEVECLEAEGLSVRVAGERRRLFFDAVFVHVGALPADELLEKAGVRRRA
jgi:thioredoxin reductase/ferredoxin